MANPRKLVFERWIIIICVGHGVVPQRRPSWSHLPPTVMVMIIICHMHTQALYDHKFELDAEGTHMDRKSLSVYVANTLKKLRLEHKPTSASFHIQVTWREAGHTC